MNSRAFMGYMVLITIISCSSNEDSVLPQKNKSSGKDLLMGVNYHLAEKDRDLITAYVNRHELKMSESPSGLFYYIYGNSTGISPKKGDLVTYHYRITLLDGTECYKSEPSNPKSFVVGHGGVESGLEEGILLMRKGQKALLIMPPHLAHGLIGDLDQIPPRASIVYQVELIDVQH